MFSTAYKLKPQTTVRAEAMRVVDGSDIVQVVANRLNLISILGERSNQIRKGKIYAE